jgi:hypothetical protein
MSCCFWDWDTDACVADEEKPACEGPNNVDESLLPKCDQDDMTEWSRQSCGPESAAADSCSNWFSQLDAAFPRIIDGLKSCTQEEEGILVMRYGEEIVKNKLALQGGLHMSAGQCGMKDAITLTPPPPNTCDGAQFFLSQRAETAQLCDASGIFFSEITDQYLDLLVFGLEDCMYQDKGEMGLKEVAANWFSNGPMVLRGYVQLQLHMMAHMCNDLDLSFTSSPAVEPEYCWGTFFIAEELAFCRYTACSSTCTNFISTIDESLLNSISMGVGDCDSLPESNRPDSMQSALRFETYYWTVVAKCGLGEDVFKLTPPAFDTCGGAYYFHEDLAFKCATFNGTRSPQSCGNTLCEQKLREYTDEIYSLVRAGFQSCGDEEYMQSFGEGVGLYEELRTIERECGLNGFLQLTPPTSVRGAKQKDKHRKIQPNGHIKHVRLEKFGTKTVSKNWNTAMQQVVRISKEAIKAQHHRRQKIMESVLSRKDAQSLAGEMLVQLKASAVKQRTESTRLRKIRQQHAHIHTLTQAGYSLRGSNISTRSSKSAYTKIKQLQDKVKGIVTRATSVSNTPKPGSFKQNKLKRSQKNKKTMPRMTWKRSKNNMTTVKPKEKSPAKTAEKQLPARSTQRSVNDFLNMKSDQQHTKKTNNPFMTKNTAMNARKTKSPFKAGSVWKRAMEAGSKSKNALKRAKNKST